MQLPKNPASTFDHVLNQLSAWIFFSCHCNLATYISGVFSSLVYLFRLPEFFFTDCHRHKNTNSFQSFGLYFVTLVLGGGSIGIKGDQSKGYSRLYLHGLDTCTDEQIFRRFVLQLRYEDRYFPFVHSFSALSPFTQESNFDCVG